MKVVRKLFFFLNCFLPQSGSFAWTDQCCVADLLVTCSPPQAWYVSFMTCFLCKARWLTGYITAARKPDTFSKQQVLGQAGSSWISSHAPQWLTGSRQLLYVRCSGETGAMCENHLMRSLMDVLVLICKLWGVHITHTAELTAVNIGILIPNPKCYWEGILAMSPACRPAGFKWTNQLSLAHTAVSLFLT